MFSFKYGLFITNEQFLNTDISIRNKWKVREVIPPNAPDIMKSQCKTLNFYRKVKKGYVLSRQLQSKIGEVVYKEIPDYRRLKKMEIENLAKHQKVVLNNIITNYNKTKPIGDVLLQMDTGLGKTRTGIALIGKIGIRTLVVVPTKHIANQWIEEVAELLPIYNVGIYNKKNIDDLDIVVCIVNTARMQEFEFYSQFGLLIIDEVHEFTSNKNKLVLWNSGGCKYRLGLTATPEYSGKGLLPFIESHLGSVLYASQCKGYSVGEKKFKVSVKIVKYDTPPFYGIPILNKAGMISTTETIAKILSNPERTDLLIDIINTEYLDGKNILVFAEHRKYLDILHERISSIISTDDIILEDSMVLKGGATKDDINNASNARIIFTTYSYSKRGVSYNHLDTLVLASPRRNGSKQIIGRILRYGSDEKIPRKIIDFWDHGTAISSQLNERQKIYFERNYNIL